MRRFTTAVLTLIVATLPTIACASGAEIFKAKCASCHPDGGNIMKKEKTLHKKELQANKLLTAKDLVRYMRNPGPGMPGFDSKSLPDKDAARLAEYILKSFK